MPEPPKGEYWISLDKIGPEQFKDFRKKPPPHHPNGKYRFK